MSKISNKEFEQFLSKYTIVAGKLQIAYEGDFQPLCIFGPPKEQEAYNIIFFLLFLMENVDAQVHAELAQKILNGYVFNRKTKQGFENYLEDVTVSDCVLIFKLQL